MRIRFMAVGLAAVAVLGAIVGITAILAWPGGGAGSTPATDGSTPVANSSRKSSDSTSSGQLSQTSACLSAADVYDQVRPTVVEITSTSGGENSSAPRAQGTGSGIIIDDQGSILTNEHVVAGANSLDVKLANGTTLSAHALGSDPGDDLAVIRADLSGNSVTSATLGDSDSIRVGDPVLAIGNPFELEGTLTQGIVSATGRTFSEGIGTRPIRNMIQTDAPVNPGNSGGPLIDCQARIIGINTALDNPTGSNVNVGIAFAVSINTAKKSVPDMLAGRTVSHPWLGIAGRDLTPNVAKDVGLSVQSGVYIAVVSSNSPAQKAGLHGAFTSENQAAQSTSLPAGGDVITAVNGQAVSSVDQLATYLDSNQKVGDKVTLTVIRQGNEQTIEATLAEWPSAQ